MQDNNVQDSIVLVYKYFGCNTCTYKYLSTLILGTCTYTLSTFIPWYLVLVLKYFAVVLWLVTHNMQQFVLPYKP